MIDFVCMLLFSNSILHFSRASFLSLDCSGLRPLVSDAQYPVLRSEKRF